MPMSESFRERLEVVLPRVVAHFGTPFHIYDELGILETITKVKRVFSGVFGFKEYFAVKALPNPVILSLMRWKDCGFDCSSIPELELARRTGAGPQDIMFTSNNTTREEFEAAEEGGCILNLDDISLIPKVPDFPELICFRYNPGQRRTGNSIIGKPEEAKYGVSHDQIVHAYRLAKRRGAKRFGLHTMLCSNELDYTYVVETAKMLLDIITKISRELKICFEFINIGGGIGIPYRPDQPEFNLGAMGREITDLLKEFNDRYRHTPNLYMESGRYMTGPHGVLVTKVINRKEIYRTHVGVDACMTALMRPAIYGAYHHVTVFHQEHRRNRKREVVDVVGSICENCDKFAVQRKLPETKEGDVVLVHDTGAHGLAMGFNYNGRLRPQELLLRHDGAVQLIRRAETMEDLFATLKFNENTLLPK